MSEAGDSTGRSSSTSPGCASSGCDQALAVTLPAAVAEEAGAILMEVFGPFEEVRGPSAGSGTDEVTLVFYPVTTQTSLDAPASPRVGSQDLPSPAEVLALLPHDLQQPGVVRVESSEVARDWVDGWKTHFRPIVTGLVRIRPPWEAPLGSPPAGLVEVVINPGLGFGTGLHPTTRGTLRLLQEERSATAGPGSAESGDGRSEPDAASAEGAGRGRLLDAGTGSGVLAIAAARLGWRPIVAFDNDLVALVSARENVEVNDVAEIVELLEAGVGEMLPAWSNEATVLANMTLEPVLALLDRVAAAGSAGRPRRVVVSGILACAQEQELLRAAHRMGLTPGRRVYEAEWVSLELLPASAAESPPGPPPSAESRSGPSPDSPLPATEE
jgi:ribosomal protein L11 methyltransferase